MPASQPEHVLVALKRVAACLRDAGIPFALGGGLAAWARGGPPSEKDVDLLIREADRERAHEVLDAAGFRTEVPPEGWLVKAWDDEILIDLIFRPSGLVVDDALLATCDELSVHAVRMPVMRIGDLLVSKLLSLTEHHLDYGPALEISRALREQIDWLDVQRRTEQSPFARTFLTLVRELGIADPPTDDTPATGAAAAPTPDADVLPLALLEERAS
ncbi:MAG: nucleotidyltransferase [Acidimicrobiales bacterium]